ncbi:MAG: MarR family transcriptional regulator [Candidatus Thermoplasmatota archaeon]|nr:MarR family transcriptional regulator [Candidatus Thermoplasmatota archaeon]
MDEERKQSSLELWRLITSINKIWSRQVEKRLSDNGLSIMEFRILKTLNNQGAQPMIKLAEANMITQGWVTNIVDKLEEKGLVHRLRSQDDRRVINIVTTERGRSFFTEIKDLHEKFIIDTLDFLSPEDMNNVKCILSRVEEQIASKVSRQSPVAMADTDPK